MVSLQPFESKKKSLCPINQKYHPVLIELLQLQHQSIQDSQTLPILPFFLFNVRILLSLLKGYQLWRLISWVFLIDLSSELKSLDTCYSCRLNLIMSRLCSCVFDLFVSLVHLSAALSWKCGEKYIGEKKKVCVSHAACLSGQSPTTLVHCTWLRALFHPGHSWMFQQDKHTRTSVSPDKASARI